VGVPPTTLPRLFDMFYRTDQARSNTARGSGLGLAIARGIVQNFGGRIWAEGTSGGGLTIKIAFPWEERPAGGIRNEEHPDC
jgi:two-component system sensor histidine kinase VicK